MLTAKDIFKSKSYEIFANELEKGDFIQYMRGWSGNINAFVKDCVVITDPKDPKSVLVRVLLDTGESRRLNPGETVIGIKDKVRALDES